MLVAVDDVHLADDSSRRWLTEAARHVDRLPVLLVATERSQYDVEPRPAGLTQALSPSLVRTHRLAPLSDRAAAGLVRDAFPDAPARWVEECVRAGAGNPLLLHALLDDLGGTPHPDGVPPVPDSCAALYPGSYPAAVSWWLKSAGPATADVARCLAALEQAWPAGPPERRGALRHALPHPRTPSSNTAYAQTPPPNAAYRQAPPSDGVYREASPLGGASPQASPLDGVYGQVSPLGGASPQASPLGGAYPQPSSADGVYRQAPPSDGVYREASPLGGASPQASPLGGAYPQPSSADGVYRQAPPADGVYRQAPPSDGVYREASPLDGVYGQVSPFGTASPQASPTGGAYGQVSPSGTGSSQALPSDGAYPQAPSPDAAYQRVSSFDTARRHPHEAPTARSRRPRDIAPGCRDVWSAGPRTPLPGGPGAELPEHGPYPHPDESAGPADGAPYPAYAVHDPYDGRPQDAPGAVYGRTEPPAHAPHRTTLAHPLPAPGTGVGR
ncbi:hypothetical protein SVIOM342S_00710 [Streptomyces violaceorubidus]